MNPTPLPTWTRTLRQWLSTSFYLAEVKWVVIICLWVMCTESTSALPEAIFDGKSLSGFPLFLRTCVNKTKSNLPLSINPFMSLSPTDIYLYSRPRPSNVWLSEKVTNTVIDLFFSDAGLKWFSIDVFQTWCRKALSRCYISVRLLCHEQSRKKLLFGSRFMPRSWNIKC